MESTPLCSWCELQSPGTALEEAPAPSAPPGQQGLGQAVWALWDQAAVSCVEQIRAPAQGRSETLWALVSGCPRGTHPLRTRPEERECLHGFGCACEAQKTVGFPEAPVRGQHGPSMGRGAGHQQLAGLGEGVGSPGGVA